MASGEDTGTVWRGRAVLHVDMDAFFTAVEQFDHPEWRGRPVVVGGSPEGRGVISAASYEARRYGVRSAMPSAQAAKRLPPDAVWAPGRYERYSELSRAVRVLFRSETPHVEMASIDEGYLDVTPTDACPEHPVIVARRIQAEVDAMGLSCSIGVATSKSVAKIASDMDKPHGLTVVAPGDEEAFLAPLPVGLMPGVGKVAQERLVSHGVRTLGEVAQLDDATARDLLGSFGPELVRRAGGVDPSEVRPARSAKSVSREHTFPEDVRSEARVVRELRDLCEQLAVRLRRKGVAGRTVTVKLRYADFTTRVVSRTLRSATDVPQELFATAREALRTVWVPGTGLRLLGVGVSNLEDPAEQLDIFDASARTEREDRLVRSLERIRERFGEDAVDVGLETAGPGDGSDKDHLASAQDSSSGE